MKYKLLFFLLLSALIILVIGVFRPDPMNSKTKERFFWNNKINDQNKYNFIVIGDSRAYRGIAPSQIEQRLPKYTVKNLGFSSGGFGNDVFQLAKKYINFEEEIDCIILLAITPHSLTKVGSEGAQLKSLKKTGVFEDWIIKNVIKNLSFFDPIIPSELAAKAIGYGYYHNYQMSGWIESYKQPIEREKSLNLYKKEFRDNKFSNEAFNILKQNIDTLINMDIDFFVVRMPVFDKLKIIENLESGFDEAFVRKELEKVGAHWITVNDTLYKTYDGSHLDGSSARLFSKFISQEIKKRRNN